MWYKTCCNVVSYCDHTDILMKLQIFLIKSKLKSFLYLKVTGSTTPCEVPTTNPSATPCFILNLVCSFSVVSLGQCSIVMCSVLV